MFIFAKNLHILPIHLGTLIKHRDSWGAWKQMQILLAGAMPTENLKKMKL